MERSPRRLEFELLPVRYKVLRAEPACLAQLAEYSLLRAEPETLPVRHTVLLLFAQAAGLQLGRSEGRI